jgi:hypothetical protein
MKIQSPQSSVLARRHYASSKRGFVIIQALERQWPLPLVKRMPTPSIYRILIIDLSTRRRCALLVILGVLIFVMSVVVIQQDTICMGAS